MLVFDRKCRAAQAVLLALCTSAALAAAAPTNRERARELAGRAFELVKEQKWEAAREHYRDAYALLPAPTLAVREARCLVEIGRYVEASAAYDRAIQRALPANPSAVFRQAQLEARDEQEQLKAKIPHLTVVVRGSPAQVMLDDQSLKQPELGRSLPVDPGKHTIRISNPAGASIVESVVVVEGERRTLVLDVPSSALAAPMVARRDGVSPDTDGSGASVYRTLGWSAVGVGAAGLAVGVFSGLKATSQGADLETACPSGECPSSRSGDVDSYERWRSISTVGYAVGLVGLGAGVSLLVFGPRDEPKQQLAVGVTGQGVQLRGAF